MCEQLYSPGILHRERDVGTDWTVSEIHVFRTGRVPVINGTYIRVFRRWKE